MNSIRFEKDRLFYLDQTLLPLREKWCECRSLKDALGAIKTLKVRGAPLIGVFAAYALWVALRECRETDPERFVARCRETAETLNRTRPTAVNLSWALEKIMTAAERAGRRTVPEIKKMVLREARRIHREDVRLCGAIGRHGLGLISKGDTILTHCNAGALATAGSGTALAVIYAAAKKYKDIKVYADETRPLLQGARLTCWELARHRVPVTLICDNMAADLMRRGCIDKIIVGADRIAANGDTANKIGTYSLAVNARYHHLPFYVAAPFSTFDPSLREGKAIPIEERDPEEVRSMPGGCAIAPKKVKVHNPAFDVTPHALISAIVTDKGVVRPPFGVNIKKMFGR